MSSASTEDDEDLKSAIALSLAESEAQGSVHLTESLPRTEHVNDSNGTASSTFLGSLDRKAMEAERLARMANKRGRSVSPPPPRSRKAPKVEESTVSLPSGARLTSFATVLNQDQRGRKSETAQAANEKLRQHQTTAAIKEEPANGPSTLEGSIKYPNGIVKKTWAFGFERNGDDVKLEEVLEPRTLHIAVLSAFQWDSTWVLDKLNLATTKCIFIMQAETDELRQKLLQESEEMRSFLRLCFPPMYAPIHCMHSKLMLLFHPDKLRIAIPTANLLNFDWGETGVMEYPDGEIRNTELHPFAKELIYFLERQHIGQDVRDGLLKFDFSATKDMMFIHTTGGTHFGEDAGRTGLPGLARAVRQLDLQSQDSLQIDFAASSIGSLNDDFLRYVHAAARGEDMIARANSANAKAKADFFKPASKSPSESMGIREKVRIYFPTQDTVKSSRAGAAGTICLNRKWFESEKFPRTAFRDYRSTRSGLLSHNKILFARGKQAGADSPAKDVAWAYVGSANMSESAWGKLVYDKKEKAWKMSCRNWECGVLLPVSAETLARQRESTTTVKEEKEEDSETESEDDSALEEPASKAEDIIDMSVFEGVVRPPFEIPGARYGGKQPWYFLESK